MSRVFINDSFYSTDEAKISPFDRGFVYGDSVYEVVLVHNGKLFFVEEHVERMINSLKMVHINGFEKDRLASIIKQIHQENQNIKYALLYLQISRGVQTKRYGQYDKLKPTIVGYIEEMKPEDFYKEKKASISCKVVKDPRRYQRNIKMNSLMPMVITKYEANLEGFDDIIFEDRNTNKISESSTSNLFIVDKDKNIITHPNGNEILPGTTRYFLIQEMKKNGLNVKEDYFEKKDLYSATEVFVTGAIKLVVPVTKIDNVKINSEKIGEITKFCQQKMIEFISK